MSPPEDETPERETEPADSPASEGAAVDSSASEGAAVDENDRSLTQDLDEVRRGRPERAFNVGAILGFLVTAAAAIFLIQNSRSTSFDWLWLDFELPLWIALLGAVGVGIVLVMTVLAVHTRRQARIGRREEAASRLREAIDRD